MLILAVDTSTAMNTVAVCDDNDVFAESVVRCGRAHAERLFDTISSVLLEARVDLKRVEALAVSIGPGSFTGLRIGCAAWKGLAHALNLPLIPVPTLDAMTRLMPAYHGLVCPVLDARMKEVFFAVYHFNGMVESREKICDETVGSIDHLIEVVTQQGATRPLFMGDGASIYADKLQTCFDQAYVADWSRFHPRASLVAFEAMDIIKKEDNTGFHPASVVPVYLRKSQPEVLRDARRAATTQS